MFWKLLTLAVILGFAWWRFRQFLRIRRLRARGEPLPAESGKVRPITVLAALMLSGYGGYLIYVVVSQALVSAGD